MNYDVTDNDGFTQTTTLRLIKRNGYVVRIEQRWVKPGWGVTRDHLEEVWKPVENQP
jgi:hypothetical protein